MGLSIERAPITERMVDVRALLTFVRDNESNATPPVDSDVVKILRGLFFVHLYGAFEKSVNEVVEKYLAAVDQLNVRTMDFSNEFLPIALDPRFTSLQAGDKWQSRLDFSGALSSTSPCRISNTVFSMQLQNTRSQTLGRVAAYIGAGGSYTPDSRDSHYLDEVVEKRNQVAHGRNPPVVVGSAGRTVDLEIRLEAINRLIDGFVAMLEHNCNSLSFVKPDHRAAYLPRLDAL